MKLIRLEKTTVARIYKEHLVMDFPKEEQKPLDLIYQAMDRGIYECYGLVDETEENSSVTKGQIVGYTFLICLKGEYLIDYVAIFPEARNQGSGSQLLQLLQKQLTGAKSIIGEVEDPEKANTPEEKELQSRRLGFYLRNGFYDTGVRVKCFGVPFILIETGNQRVENEEELLRLYRMFYKEILPTQLYENCIQVG